MIGGRVEVVRGLITGLERVRMALPLSTPLPGPTPEDLHSLSHTLLEQSRNLTAEGECHFPPGQNASRMY